jgi:sugar phosphate isomerase/epimerase
MAGFKISSCSANYGYADLFRVTDRLAALGYDGIEITAMYHCIPKETPAARRREIRERTRASGLAISGLHYIFEPGTSMVSDNEAERRRVTEHVRSIIELSHDLGCSMVVVGGSKQRSVPVGMSRETGIRRVVDAFAEIGRHAEKLGVTACFEAHNRYESNVGNTLAECSRYVDEINSPAMKVAGDTYHMNIEEASLSAAIEQAGPRLAHLHLPDSHRLAPGGGHIDFTSILKSLRKIGFDGYLSFEMFGITPEMMYLPTFDACDAENDKGIRHVRDLEKRLI